MMVKINHNAIAFIGAIFSIVPIYNFLSWIIIYSKYSGYTREEKVRFFFNLWFNKWFENGSSMLSLISILFGILALVFLIYSIKKESKNLISIVKKVIIGVTFISTFMILWGLL